MGMKRRDIDTPHITMPSVNGCADWIGEALAGFSVHAMIVLGRLKVLQRLSLMISRGWVGGRLTPRPSLL